MRDEAPAGLHNVASLRWGTHLCQAFDGADDLESVLVPYFKAGLVNNERCFWVTHEPLTADRARAALGAAIPDLPARMAAGQIEIRDISEWYAPGEELQPEALVADLRDREQDALRNGYEGLRTNGNCAWVPPSASRVFQDYEELVQSTVQTRRMICMCSYGPHQTREADFFDVMRRHDLVIAQSGRGKRQLVGELQDAGQDTISAARTATLSDILISDDLERRPAARLDYLDEKLALENVARRISDAPSEVLPELVDVALDICGAHAAGVSVLDGDVFRWLGLRGELAAFEGATTPRHDSPCGVCLDQKRAVLMQHPERIYSWIRDADITVPEVLLVPLHVNGRAEIGTLWVVAAKGHFHAEHARFLTHVATFAGLALHMLQTEQGLKQALEQEKMIANEMSHRVKNMYALATSIVRMSSRNARSAKEMSDSVVARLSALAEAHGLARSSAVKGVDLTELLKTTLRPYENVKLSGPAVYLDETALGYLAMTFHELATNAVKYGALSVPTGQLDVAWVEHDGSLSLKWREQGGPAPGTPAANGFGSVLINRAISALDGDLSNDWQRTGLQASFVLPLEKLVGLHGGSHPD